jgi:hypothetical protein
MAAKKGYRESFKVEAASVTDKDGARVISAVIKGDKNLFDMTAMLEERGVVLPLQERIAQAIEKEVVA